jgi:hypothetical protein
VCHNWMLLGHHHTIESFSSWPEYCHEYTVLRKGGIATFLARKLKELEMTHI